MIKILKMLLQEDKSYSINELSEELEVSTKTIINDLKNIKKYILDTDEFCLDYEKSNVIETDMGFKSFLAIQSRILLDSLSIKFIFKLLDNPYQDINYYSDILYTSNSSLYRRITAINGCFEQYDIQITSDSTLYYIKSKNEFEYRRFFTSFLLEIFGNDISSILDNRWVEFLSERLAYMYKNNNSDISNYYIDYYSVFYFVSLKREQAGYLIEYTPSFIGTDTFFSEDQVTKFNDLGFNISIDRLHAIESSIYINDYKLTSLTNLQDMQVIEEFIDKLYSEFNISGSLKEKKYLTDIFSDIYISVRFFKVPYPFLNDRFVFFSDNIKESYSYFYKDLHHLIKMLDNTLNSSFLLYEDYLIYLLVVTLPNILDKKIDKKVAIISNISYEHAVFLSYQIAKELKKENILIDEITCFYRKDLMLKEIELYSYLISDFEFNVKTNIYIEEFPSVRDIHKIKSKLLS